MNNNFQIKNKKGQIVYINESKIENGEDIIIKKFGNLTIESEYDDPVIQRYYLEKHNEVISNIKGTSDRTDTFKKLSQIFMEPDYNNFQKPMILSKNINKDMFINIEEYLYAIKYQNKYLLCRIFGNILLKNKIREKLAVNLKQIYETDAISGIFVDQENMKLKILQNDFFTYTRKTIDFQVPIDIRIEKDCKSIAIQNKSTKTIKNLKIRVYLSKYCVDVSLIEKVQIGEFKFNKNEKYFDWSIFTLEDNNEVNTCNLEYYFLPEKKEYPKIADVSFNVDFHNSAVEVVSLFGEFGQKTNVFVSSTLKTAKFEVRI